MYIVGIFNYIFIFHICIALFTSIPTIITTSPSTTTPITSTTTTYTLFLGDHTQTNSTTTITTIAQNYYYN